MEKPGEWKETEGGGGRPGREGPPSQSYPRWTAGDTLGTKGVFAPGRLLDTGSAQCANTETFSQTVFTLPGPDAIGTAFR